MVPGAVFTETAVGKSLVKSGEFILEIIETVRICEREISQWERLFRRLLTVGSDFRGEFVLEIHLEPVACALKDITTTIKGFLTIRHQT